MKFLRPRSADSGLVTVLLVSDAELQDLIGCVECAIRVVRGTTEADTSRLKKLKAELATARKAL